MHHYRIGEMDVCIDFDRGELKDDYCSLPFVCDDAIGEAAACYRTADLDVQSMREARIAYYSGGYELLERDGQRYLVNHWQTHRHAYGISLKELQGDGEITVYCNPELNGQLHLSASYFMSTVGLHHRLLRHGMPVLHASFIGWQGKAILFAAPSQVGKSTQAELWCRHAGAQIFNGDRALLHCKQGQWYAGGFPACGSSGICAAQSLPLAAIVLLQQAPENRIEALSEKEKLHALVSGTEVYRWNMQDIDLAIAHAQRICEAVPMLRLACKPDEGAVQTLKNHLFGGVTA